MSASKRIIIVILMVLFCFGIGISVYNIIGIFSEDKQAANAYSELHNLMNEPIEPNHNETGSEATQKTESDENEPSQNDSDQAVNDDSVSEQQAYVRKRQNSMNISGVKELYPELSAWLVAEGTGIDLPVMKAADNEFYLTHLYDGTRNANGALFIDCRNTGVFTDGNTVIYGHNMGSGAMFAVLNEFKSQDFYDAHPTMMVYTAEGDYLIELICGTVEDGNYEFVRFDFTDFEDMSAYVAALQARSTFVSAVELQEGDKLVSLCTCTYERTNARYMLLGRIVELYEEEAID